MAFLLRLINGAKEYDSQLDVAEYRLKGTSRQGVVIYYASGQAQQANQQGKMDGASTPNALPGKR